MEQIWDICLKISHFTIFELENARDKLVIFDVYDLEYLNLDSENVSMTFFKSLVTVT